MEKKFPLVTFAVCAYNEENIIKECIEHILKVDYPNKEIIVGSDGNDRTNEIVKKYPVKLITSKNRIGKTNMLLKILEAAKGEIVIINDAEFFFFPENGIYNLIKYFKDKNVGGVSFGNCSPVEYEYKRGWWVFVDMVIQNLFRYYRIKKYPVKSLKDANFFLTVNAFRKSAITDLKTINDDSEIAYSLLSKGYKIEYALDVAFYAIGGSAKKLFDQIKQRSRTSVGWVEISKIYKIKLFRFYFQMLWLWLKLIASLIVLIFISLYGVIKGRLLYIFGKKSSEKIWKKIER